MVNCNICGYEAGEGKKHVWTRKAGHVVICYQCWVDLQVNEDEE